MRRQRLKVLSVSLGLTLALLSCAGCWRTVPARPKAPEALREWHGTKEEVVDFLKGPNAQATRWMVEAIGE